MNENNNSQQLQRQSECDDRMSEREIIINNEREEKREREKKFRSNAVKRKEIHNSDSFSDFAVGTVLGIKRTTASSDK